MMILRREDFASLRVDWQPKPENLARHRQGPRPRPRQLRLHRRQTLRARRWSAQTLPEVAVPRFPRAYRRTCPTGSSTTSCRCYFGKYIISEEDRNKTQQYRANEIRHGLSRPSSTSDAFLAELGIECSLHVNSADHVARAAPDDAEDQPVQPDDPTLSDPRHQSLRRQRRPCRHPAGIQGPLRLGGRGRARHPSTWRPGGSTPS